jgi:hypothetical protein
MMNIFVGRTMFRDRYLPLFGEESGLAAGVADRIMSGEQTLIMLDNDFPKTNGQTIMQDIVAELAARASAIVGETFHLPSEITDYQAFINNFIAQLNEATGSSLPETRIVGISNMPKNQVYLEQVLQGKRFIIRLLTYLQQSIAEGRLNELSLAELIHLSNMLMASEHRPPAIK